MDYSSQILLVVIKLFSFTCISIRSTPEFVEHVHSKNNASLETR
jgi:hypothetical protein